MNHTIVLNNQPLCIRQLTGKDTHALFAYVNTLSAESRSRFMPHPFDIHHCFLVCNGLLHQVTAFIAETAAGQIVAYMLLKEGLNSGEQQRLQQLYVVAGQPCCTFAPSVADAWQGKGLGAAMYPLLEAFIIAHTAYRVMVLWGGVQAGNQKARHYYKKLGYQYAGTFWYNEMDNYDMIKTL
ncbi:MAG: hypothetical protein RL172_418 [Bacteroidota bacterium]|jgi:GNAT superfamily N-acetyltransferase